MTTTAEWARNIRHKVADLMPAAYTAHIDLELDNYLKDMVEQDRADQRKHYIDILESVIQQLIAKCAGMPPESQEYYHAVCWHLYTAQRAIRES